MRGSRQASVESSTELSYLRALSKSDLVMREYPATPAFLARSRNSATVSLASEAADFAAVPAFVAVDLAAVPAVAAADFAAVPAFAAVDLADVDA